MPQPLTYLTKKVVVSNSASACADIIINALSNYLKKPQKYKLTEAGYQIKARKGLIFDPELIEVNVFEKKGLKEYTVIEVSNGIIPRGFGDKSAALTEEILQKSLDEILNLIVPNLNLIGISEENVCLKCGQTNFPLAKFCVKCYSELEAPIEDVALKEISSIVESVGILSKGEESPIAEDMKIPDILDRITDVIDGKIDPITFKEKIETISSFELGRCKNCNWNIDEKTYNFHKKGYKINCPNCDKELD